MSEWTILDHVIVIVGCLFIFWLICKSADSDNDRNKGRRQ